MDEMMNSFMPPHLIGKETETQRDSVICQRSHSQYIACFESRFL